MGTNTVGRALGRMVPLVGWAWTAWDVGFYLGTYYGPSTWYGDNPYKWFE